MMNYEIFKEVVKEKFMDFLPEQYQNMKLAVNPTEKVNHTVDGLTLMGEGVRVSPTIYINNMYKHYKDTDNLELVLTDAAAMMEKAMREAPDNVPSLDMEIVAKVSKIAENKQKIIVILDSNHTHQHVLKELELKIHHLYLQK